MRGAAVPYLVEACDGPVVGLVFAQRLVQWHERQIAAVFEG